MYEYLPQALTSLATALDIGKSIAGIGNVAKRQEAVVQFTTAIIAANSQIIAAQKDHSAMAAEIDELKKKCVRLQDWAAERKTYTRSEIAGGIFAYVANDSLTDFEHAHKYCCNCFDKTVPSTLQQGSESKPGMGRIRTLVCPNGCPRLEFRGGYISAP